MTDHYKPAGHSAVSPYLAVNGADATIAFLKRVFNAEELGRWLHTDGIVMHAEVRIDDTVLMLADGTDDWPAYPAHVHVYVPDVDETYARALAAGATSLQEPIKGGGDDRRGGVRDPWGTSWWIATSTQ